MIALSLATLLPTGCGRSDPFLLRPADPSPRSQLLPAEPWAPRALAMFRGRDGGVATWADLMEAAGRCDVVIVGEQHDDATAHAFELALVSDLLASFPGSILSLEMLERDEQEILDAHLAGEIPLAAFIEATGSATWGGRRWEDSYGPLIEAARRTGSGVVAANSPRMYVRRARTEGYEALRELPPEERSLFDLPDRLDEGDYRARFEALMVSARERAGTPPPTREEVDAALRPQMVWDATMARSIAGALRERGRGSAKVVHVVGRFHSDFDGGLVSELRRAAPFASILTVSRVPEASRHLREEDRGRAYVVVYTGGLAPTPPIR